MPGPFQLSALQEQAGPLPVWAWAGIAAIGGVAVLSLVKKKAPKAPTMAATAPAGPEMPMDAQGVPGAVDSGYGGSGSYTMTQSYVCPSGQISFDPSQCAPGTTGDGNPPPPPPGDGVAPCACPDGTSLASASWPSYLLTAWLRDLQSGAPAQGVWHQSVCNSVCGFTGHGCPAGQHLAPLDPGPGNPNPASYCVPDHAAAGPSLDFSGSSAAALPLQGARMALPSGNPRGTGF